jgi:hypothetical protein
LYLAQGDQVSLTHVLPYDKRQSAGGGGRSPGCDDVYAGSDENGYENDVHNDDEAAFSLTGTLIKKKSVATLALEFFHLSRLLETDMYFLTRNFIRI